MSDNGESSKNNQARSLARDTGITEAQARELIDLLGMHRPSLLREARLLKQRELGKGKQS
ncbi:hypothetical protein [Pseudaminobacter sp. NGMCC 1.201702]|uniref:hypothetical protein n=1 Tax=Pseudaminobacter sp. NGMCC 1.201702 TaxID=3391825 RepID=UPI0039EF2958